MGTKADRKRALAYLRVSGKGQVTGDGFPRQRQAIEQWARREGYHIAAWYEEEGVSGSIAKRPALARLLLDLGARADVQIVIVERLDRLARDLIVQETIIAEVSRLGKQLASASEGQDLLTDDPSRKLVRQIFGAIAEYDRQMTVAKLAVARARKRATEGRCEGRKPFGNRPEEKETLRRIKELRRQRRGRRLGYQRIAKALNREGLPSRTGRPWQEGTVRGIVKRTWPAMA